MSNTFTTTGNDILLNVALEGFTSVLAPFRAFSVNASPEPAQRGDYVKVLFVDNPATAATDFSSSYSIQAAEATGKRVQLNNHKYVSWGITDTEMANNPQIELERFAFTKGAALAKAVFQDVLSLVTYANYGTSALVSSAANFDADDLATLRGVAGNADWPDVARSLLLSPDYITYLLQDSAIQSASNLGDAMAIREGKVGRLMGFDIFETPHIPDNSQSLAGVMCVPDGILFANRYLAPQEGHSYTEARPVSDPKTGLTIGWRKWYDEDSAQMRAVLECNYGYAVGNSAGLERIASTATVYS